MQEKRNAGETDPVSAIESAVGDLVRNEVVQYGTECQAIGETLAKVLNADVLMETEIGISC